MTELASKLLTIRGYLQEDEFDFVLSILNSTFVREGIVPDEEVYRETQNQKRSEVNCMIYTRKQEACW